MIPNYQQYFKTLTRVSRAIHSGNSTAEVLKSIVSNITAIMEAKGCIYWIVNEKEKNIVSMVSEGFHYESLAGVGFESLLEIFNPEEQQVTFIEDARYDMRLPNLERLGKKRVKSVIGMPFPITEDYLGILAVYFGNKRSLLASEIDFLRALGEQGAISLQRALRYDDDMLKNFKETVEGFALAIEAKDTVTHGHSLKVAKYARMIAENLGFSEKEIETLYCAGLLHDIGKIGMPGKVLSRLGKLQASEMDIIRKHPVIGAGILRPLSFLGDVVPAVLYHHERFDGSGYPEGLKGDQIPMGARILTVCDVFETMVSGRPHMDSISPPQAISRIKAGRGILYDPGVVDAFVDAVSSSPESIIQSEAENDIFKKYGEEMDAIAVKSMLDRKLAHLFPAIF